MREVWARYGRGMGEGYLGLCELELELLHTLLLPRRAREQGLRLGAAALGRGPPSPGGDGAPG